MSIAIERSYRRLLELPQELSIARLSDAGLLSQCAL
jgi:hypothetical protein